MATTADKKHRLHVFEERFRKLRENRKMTQSEFADFVGISRPTIGFYENGDRIPDALSLRKIAQACHVPSDWLIGLSDNQLYENVAIGKELGLTDEAIDTLRFNTGWDHHQAHRKLNAINRLLDTDDGFDLIYILGVFLDIPNDDTQLTSILISGDLIDDYSAVTLDNMFENDSRSGKYRTLTDDLVMYEFSESYVKQELLLQKICEKLRELRVSVRRVAENNDSMPNSNENLIEDSLENLLEKAIRELPPDSNKEK